MPELERSIRLAASAEDVWAAIGDFDGMPNWHPAVNASRVWQEGAEQVRELVVVGNIRLKERLVSHDDGARTYRYAIVDGPLPVEGFASKIAVSDNGDGTSTVTWSAQYQLAGASDEIARESIGGIYDAGLQSLGIKFGTA